MSDTPSPQLPAPGLALDRFDVTGFRGLSDLVLDRLGGVTLLVGANNTGKTSILEALAISGNALDPREWMRVARLRSPLRPRIYSSLNNDVVWLFPKVHDQSSLDGEYGKIALRGRGRREFDVEATCHAIVGRPSSRLFDLFGNRLLPSPGQRGVPVESVMDIKAIVGEGQLEEDSSGEDGWQIDISVNIGSRGESSPSVSRRLEFQVWSRSGPDLGPPTARARVPHILPIVFLTPYGHRDEAVTVQRFSDAVDEGRRDDLLYLMRGFDHETEAIEIGTVEEGQRPTLKVKLRRSGLVPVSVLGDGMRRALSMALAVERARGGLLLIDEIESALHVSALDRLFPWVVEACRRFDVQLFATTHSLETIDAIAKLASAQEPDGLVAFNLGDRDPENGSAKRYSGPTLHRLVHERGLDVR